MIDKTRRYLRAGAVTAAAAVALTLAGGAAAQAETDARTPDNDVIATIAKASSAPGVPDVFLGGVHEAVLPTDGKFTVATPHGDVTIELPGSIGAGVAVANSLRAYENLPDVSTVPVTKTDGSVQIATVIASSASPTEYRYVIESEKGSHLKEVDEGYIAVVSEDGDLIAGVAPAWAIDANGEDVRTYFEIDGNTLVQYVEHRGGSAYPIVADPWVGGTYLESYQWLTSHRVEYRPTWYGSWGCFGSVSCAAAWQGSAQAELVNANTGTYKTRAGYSTTRNQIGCHMFGAGVKSPWNIETNAPDVGLAGFIATGCNP